ncbi:hypothetical protein IG631_00224 [Alternaria alternata]|nr:hypothetical protein IG631_00224 [Alternaria alternata]
MTPFVTQTKSCGDPVVCQLCIAYTWSGQAASTAQWAPPGERTCFSLT